MINLYINERRVGDVTVLDLKGRVRIGGGTVALHKSIRCLVDEGKTQILLNLGGVSHIDSSGLGELVGSLAPWDATPAKQTNVTAYRGSMRWKMSIASTERFCEKS